MSKIVWDATGERKFEMGVDHGVLYVAKDNSTDAPEGSSYKTGVPWNGLTGFTNSPEGAEPTDLWADNIKYATLRSAETFGGTIEAYTYPDEFGECDGSASPVTGVRVGQQKRKSFAFCYRTKIGTDTAPESDDAYLIHIIYNCTASPSERSYETVNDSPDAITFSWEIKSNPVNVSGYEVKPTSEIIIDSTRVSSAKMTAIEEVLYGKDGTGDAAKDPILPDPGTLLGMLAESSTTT